MKKRSTVIGVVAAMATTLIGAGGVRAQDVANVAAAKKEGRVVWYTSTPIRTAQVIAQMFEKRYGVHVELFRSGGSAVLRRFLQEAQAKRVFADVLTTSDPSAAEQLAQSGTFVPFKPKNFNKILASGRDAAGDYIAQRLNIITFYARSDKVAPADIPHTWESLLDPKYKGKLVMTDPSFTSLQLTVVGMNAKIKGWQYYKKLRANDIMVVPGNQQVSDMVKSGERTIAAGALDSYAAEDRKSGSPIESIYPSDGTYIIPSPTSVVKGSPHPNAARLLAQFMISDKVQKLFPADGAYSARIDLPPPAGAPAIKNIKEIKVDYAYLRKESAVVKKKFDEIFE